MDGSSELSSENIYDSAFVGELLKPSIDLSIPPTIENSVIDLVAEKKAQIVELSSNDGKKTSSKKRKKHSSDKSSTSSSILSQPNEPDPIQEEPTNLEENGVRIAMILKDQKYRGDVLNSLSSDEFQLQTKGSRIIAGFALPDTIEDLASNMFIQSIWEDKKLHTASAQSFPQINSNQVTNKQIEGVSVNGSGYSACIVDTGINYDDNALIGGDTGNFPNNKVIAGYNWCGDTGCSTENSDPDDTFGHGTGMAGIIAGSGTYTGIAPGAKLLAMRSSFDNITYTAQVAAGIEGCVNNATTHNVSVIYIGLATPIESLGDDPSFCEGAFTPFLQQAQAMNITNIAPAGQPVLNNVDGETTGISILACAPEVISVGGVEDGSGPNNQDDFWNSSHRHAILDLVAPADEIQRPTIGGLANAFGTSEAAAHVAGAAILLIDYWQQKYDYRLNNSEVRDIFVKTGKPVNDTIGTQLNFPRLDVLRAIHYETIPPQVTLLTTNNDLSDGSAIFKYNVSDDHEINNCSLYLDNVLTQTNNNINKTFDQNFTINLTTANYEWNVTCFDNSTFPNNGSSTVNTLVVDSDSPAVTLESPSNASTNTTTGTIEFHYNVIDAVAAVHNCSLYINDTLNQTDNTITESTQQTFASVFLPNGNWNWSVQCNDNVSNLGVSSVRTLTIAVNQPPSIDTFTPTNTTLKQNETHNLSFSITSSDPDLDVLTYTWYVNGEVFTAGTQSLTYTFNATQQGTNNITVTVTDGTETVTQEWLVEVNDLVLISEFVTDPQTDWGEDGATSASDEYFELYNPNTFDVNIDGWQFKLIDSDTNTANLAGILKAGEYLTILNPLGNQNNNGQIQLLDDNGQFVDVVVHGGAIGEAPDGNAVNVYDECISRVPENLDTNNDTADFQKQGCTFNATNLDNTKPAISNINVPETKDDSGLVTWNTDEFTNSSVYYGTDANNLENVTDLPSLARSHSKNLTGLTISTQYFYNISSCDTANNCELSGPNTFTTSCTPSFANTSFTSYYDTSLCLSNDTKNQEKNLTQYDTNSCGSANVTHYEYQSVACDFCTPNWVEVNSSCLPSDQVIGEYNDTNSCFLQTGLGSDNNPPANNTYACDFCTPSMVNTTFSSFYDTSLCYANDTKDQQRNLTQYDTNNCGEVANVTYYDYQEAACDFCTPSMVNTTFSSFYDTSLCYANDTKDQQRNLTQYDTNNCGEVANVTYYDYQEAACDFCTPSLTNTTFTPYYDTSLCYANDTKDQQRNLTQYDTNNCGEVANVTYYDYQESACDFCTPSLVNTSWSSWTNISCTPGDTINQTRSLVRYDTNNCGEVANVTFTENRNTETCDFCTPSWSQTNSTCQPNDLITGTYNDGNNCFALTALTSDNNKPSNNNYTCDFCTPNLVNTSWSNWIDTNVCQTTDMKDQKKTRTQYDSNNCNEIVNITFQELQTVSCDFCTPSWYEINNTCQVTNQFTSWFNDSNSCYSQTSLSNDNNAPANNTYACTFCTENITVTGWTNWYNISLCLANDTVKQHRNSTQYDANNCGTFADQVSKEAQAISCDFCTPSLTNTSWNNWYNTSICYSNDTVDQQRNSTQYDTNNCGEIANVTFIDNRGVSCDACTPSLTNSSWSSWTDISACYANNTVDQQRTQTQYDTNNCNEIANQSYDEFRTTNCLNLNNPDLVVENLQILFPTNPNTQGQTLFSFIIRNIGQSKAINVDWELDYQDGSIQSSQGLDLEVGDSWVVDEIVQFNSTGNHTIKAIADNFLRIPESNENNNELQLSVTVT